MKKYILLLFLLLLPSHVDAASIHAIAGPSSRVGEAIAVDIFIDTEGQNINALEGTVELSSGLTVEDIRYGGSVVSFWLEEPAKNSGSVLSFSGVIPGGYQGSPERVGRGNVFTLYVRAEKTGTERVSFRDSVAYVNDGEGTALNLSKGPTSVSITDEGDSEASVPADLYPPEVFSPEVVSGEPYGIQGNVLIFATQDKDSGVARYEIGFSYLKYAPAFFVEWIPGISPFQISEEAQNKYIFVRAVDRDGNVRVAHVVPKGVGVATLITWGIPLLLSLLVVFFGYRLLRPKVSLK